MPLVVPCYNGKELDVDPAMVGKGLAALSIKHEFEDLGKCKIRLPNKSISNINMSCYRKDEMKSRNSFWSIHKPELRKLSWAKKLSTRQIVEVLEEHALGDHYEDEGGSLNTNNGNSVINSVMDSGGSNGGMNKMEPAESQSSELRCLKTENRMAKNFDLDLYLRPSHKLTDVSDRSGPLNLSRLCQDDKAVFSAQCTSLKNYGYTEQAPEPEFTPVLGPRSNSLKDDDLGREYTVHKSYVGMCIDMGHLTFRSPHVYIVADCESDPAASPGPGPGPADQFNEECILGVVSGCSSANQHASISATASVSSSEETDSLVSALRLHETMARPVVAANECGPVAGHSAQRPRDNMFAGVVGQDTLKMPIRKAFQHSPDESNEVTVILPPRYDLDADSADSVAESALDAAESARIQRRVDANNKSREDARKIHKHNKNVIAKIANKGKRGNATDNKKQHRDAIGSIDGSNANNAAGRNANKRDNSDRKS